MLWNLKKMMKRKSRTGTIEKRFVEFGKAMGKFAKMVNNVTRTDNPKGKVGVLETVHYWNRSFGKPRWVFRKFEKKPFDNAEGFIKALEKRGFRKLGSGAFSTVLAKDDQNRVIKVIRRPDGWINYIHWAAQIGEAGRFAPKVFSYKKIKGRRKDFAIAVMERFKETVEDTPEGHDLKLLPDIVWRAEGNAMAEKFTEMLAPGLMDYLKKMKEKWGIPIKNFDLHDGNLMFRTNGTVVVVDPVSKGEEGIARLRAGDLTPAVALKLLTSLNYWYTNKACGL